MNTLKWKVANANGKTEVEIQGAITEDADLNGLLALEGSGLLALDLAGVVQINSCGVREWIHFVRKLSDGDRGFELVRCSPAIVRQLNTIANFRGAGSVRSVMLPYYCSSCRSEAQVPLDLTGASREIADEIPCAKCGGTMEFDDMPSTYVSFAG